MNFISFAFGTIYGLLNTIVIPIPVTTSNVYMFSLFDLLIAFFLISLIVFTLNKLDFKLGISYSKNSDLNGYSITTKTPVIKPNIRKERK